MDPRLSAALDMANLRMSQKLEQQRLQDIAQTSLTYAVSGGIFYIDRTLLLFASDLKSKFGTNSAIILDDNMKPIEISNSEEFCDTVWNIYTKVCYEYYWNLKKLKQARSVEQVLGINE